MLEKILDTIEKYNMIEAGNEAVVALSGGADSVCLLLALNELKSILKIKVSALHVNHCLRGEESDGDERFCIELCKKYNIPIIIGRFDIKSIAKERKMSTELAARDVRYKFFAENSEGKKLATAHNANDNAETVIFNLTRGTGTKGISGIPPVRDNIIRPIIGVTREEIEKYLKEKNQSFVTDSTNLTDEYTRNKIRHNVIPVLLGINNGLFDTILSDSDNFRTDNQYIEEQTQLALEKCYHNKNKLYALSSFHPAIRHRCISYLLSENDIEVSRKKIDDIDNICLNGGKINLSRDIYAVSENNTLSIVKISEKIETLQISEKLKEGKNIFFDKCVYIKYCNINEKTSSIYIDADKICGDAIIRNRRAGDKIKLYGKNFTSSVKTMFNSKFKKSEREKICFICDELGPIFIEKIGIAQRVCTDENTKKIIEIKIDCV